MGSEIQLTTWVLKRQKKTLVNHGQSKLPFPQLVSFAGFLLAINSYVPKDPGFLRKLPKKLF